MQMMVQLIGQDIETCGSNVKKRVEHKTHMDCHYLLWQLKINFLSLLFPLKMLGVKTVFVGTCLCQIMVFETSTDPLSSLV